MCTLRFCLGRDGVSCLWEVVRYHLRYQREGEFYLRFGLRFDVVAINVPRNSRPNTVTKRPRRYTCDNGCNVVNAGPRRVAEGALQYTFVRTHLSPDFVGFRGPQRPADDSPHPGTFRRMAGNPPNGHHPLQDYFMRHWTRSRGLIRMNPVRFEGVQTQKLRVRAPVFITYTTL